MKKSLFILVVFYGSLVTGMAQVSESWVLQNNSDSIEVYTKFNPGSEYKSIRIVAYLRCSFTTLLAQMKDVDSHTLWVSHCVDSKKLATLGDTGMIYYEYYNFPWPASDRDVVVHVNIHYDPVHKMMMVTQEGIPSYIPQKKGVVRVPNYHGSWKFIEEQDGLIHGEYTASLEPGGDIPAWFINLFAAYGPYDTIKKLKGLIENKRP